MTTRLSQQTLIRVSGERKLQLQDVADALGAKTFSAAIGKLLEFAAAQGLIEHDIPGVKLNSFPDGLTVALDDNQLIRLTHDQTRSVVQMIRDFVSGKTGIRSAINSDCNFGLTRRGGGFIVAMPMATTTPKTWGHDIVLEFANLLERELVKIGHAN